MMKTKQQICILIICTGIFSACHTGQKEAGDCNIDSLVLERVSYNQPDLEVDLGVGLWAWPLHMDFDSDGDMDLLVGAEDGFFYYAER